MTQRGLQPHMRPPVSDLSLAGFLLSLLAALAAVSSGLGHRWGFWSFRIGFIILRMAAFAAVPAAAVSAAGVLATLIRKRGEPRKRGLVMAIAGLLIGVTAFWVPYSWSRLGARTPAIHDITTDTEDPPRFVAVLSQRYGAPNSAEYGGADVARLQKEAYPDIAPLEIASPPEAVFDAALKSAREMGWRIVEPNRKELRIEGTAATFWFGFKDDVVVRITPMGSSKNSSRVDVRSVSRVGKKDFGANARRIREFLEGVRRNV